MQAGLFWLHYSCFQTLEGYTDTQKGDLISLLSFIKSEESRLKKVQVWSEDQKQGSEWTNKCRGE